MNNYFRKKRCRFYFKIIILTLFTVTFFSCQRISHQVPPFLTKIVKNVKDTQAPDSRLELFDIQLAKKGDQLIVSGEVTNARHKKILLDSLMGASKYYDFLDDIVVLPSEELKSQEYGIVYVSVANMRRTPKHSAELVNQTLLGTVLNLYKKDGGFYYSRNKDGYLGWVSGSSMVEIDSLAAADWDSGPQVICNNYYGLVLEKPILTSRVIVHLVPGAKLKKIAQTDSWITVETPDGRVGYVKNNLLLTEEYYNTIKAERGRIIITAEKYLGIPYLWGGTSTNGFDCSGFVQTVFNMNNFALPRDTNQMVNIGKKIDLSENLVKMLPGDLLFFGPNENRMTHVGIYMGDLKFIHSSGWVHINSLDPKHPLYNEYRHKNLRTARRLLDR